MKTLDKVYVGKRAVVTDTDSHYFSVGDEVLITGIDGSFYDCHSDDRALDQVLCPSQLKLVEKEELSVGDTVRLNPEVRTGFEHYFTEGIDAEIQSISSHVLAPYGRRAKLYWVEENGTRRAQIVPLKELVKSTPAEEAKPSENPSRLVLMRAEFKDSEGRNVVVKRSPCRHYYVKVDGSKQQRVSLEQIKKVVESV